MKLSQMNTDRISRKTLAVILVGVFLFTNTLSWAQEDRFFSTGMEKKAFSSDPVTQNNKLAPPSKLNSEDFKYSLTVAAICKHIEHDGNLDDKSYLNDVLARLNAEKNSNITVLPYEIIIEIPNEGLAIRYFDPTKANVITPYSDISKLETKVIGPRLNRQVIHRTKAITAPSTQEIELAKLDKALKEKYKAIVFDIDETLTDDKANVPDEVISKIINLVNNGIYVVLASGRVQKVSDEDVQKGIHSIEGVMAKIRAKVGNNDKLGYLLCFEENGAIGVNGFAAQDPRKKEFDLGVVKMEKEYQEEISMELIAKHPDRLLYPEHKKHGVAIWIKEEYRTTEFIMSLVNETKALLTSKGLDFEVMGTPVAVDIASKGVKKSNALRVLAEFFNIPESRVATVGDQSYPGGNDHSILERKGGFCVGEYVFRDSLQVSLPMAIGLKGFRASLWLMDNLAFDRQLYDDLSVKIFDKVAGLPVKLMSNIIEFGDDVVSEPVWKRTLRDAAPSMAEPELAMGPHANDIIYYGYRNVRCNKDTEIIDRRKLRFDVSVMDPGFIGKEIMVTKGHLHPCYPEIYEVWSGYALYIQQHTNEAGVVDDIVVTFAKPGDKVLIYAGYAHRTINIGKTPLVHVNWISDDVGGKEKTPAVVNQDFSAIEQRNGFAVRLFSNGKDSGTFEHNTKWKIARPLSKLIHFTTPSDTISELGINANTPMYRIINNPGAAIILSDYLRSSSAVSKETHRNIETNAHIPETFQSLRTKLFNLVPLNIAMKGSAGTIEYFAGERTAAAQETLDKIVSVIKQGADDDLTEILAQIKSEPGLRYVVNGLHSIAETMENGLHRARAYQLIVFIYDQRLNISEQAKFYDSLTFKEIKEVVKNAVAKHMPAAHDMHLIKGAEATVEAPVRIEFVSECGSDILAMSLEKSGRVINTSIKLKGQRPIQVKVRAITEKEIRIHSVDLQETVTIQDKEALRYKDPNDRLRLVKAALFEAGIISEEDERPLEAVLANIGGGLEITTDATSIPPGSGLGVSGALGSAVIAGLLAVAGEDIGKNIILAHALNLEQRLDIGGGWQDPVGGMFGGFKYINAEIGSAVPEVNRLPLHSDTPDKLKDRMVLLYLGQGHYSGDILQTLVRDYLLRKKEQFEGRKRLRVISEAIRSALIEGDISRFGKLLSDCHRERRIVTGPMLTTDFIEHIFYETHDLADGGRVSGAGGGGFMILVAKEGKTEALKERLQALINGTAAEIYDYDFDNEGLHVELKVKTPASQEYQDPPEEVIDIVRRFKTFDEFERWLDKVFLDIHTGGKLTNEKLHFIEILCLLFGFEHRPDCEERRASIVKNMQLTEKDKSLIYNMFYSSDKYKLNGEIRWEADTMLETITYQIQDALKEMVDNDKVISYTRIKQYGSLLSKLRRIVGRLEDVNAEKMNVRNVIGRIMKHRTTIASDSLKYLEDMLGFNFIIDDTGMTEEERIAVLSRYAYQIEEALRSKFKNIQITKERKESRVKGFEAVNFFVQGLLDHKDLGSLAIKIQVRFKTALYREMPMYYMYKMHGSFELPPWATVIDFNGVASFREVQERVFLSFKEYFKSYHTNSWFSAEDILTMPTGWPSSFDLGKKPCNVVIDYINKNKELFKGVLGEEKQDALVRIPIEAIESVGINNIKGFLVTFQEAPNAYIELYYMSGIGEVSESVYQKYGLQKKFLPKDFKRTRENTVTLFPALKGEEINQSAIVSRLVSINITPENTILSPMGLQHDPAGFIRATILGLKMMDIARQIKEKGIDITKNQAFKDKIQLEILEQLKNVCDADDLKNFNLTPDDIIALATGTINNIITALKKLIKLLPITPIDADGLRQIYEHAKEIITAA